MGIIEAYGVLRAVHLDQQIQAVQLLGILLGGGNLETRWRVRDHRHQQQVHSIQPVNLAQRVYLHLAQQPKLVTWPCLLAHLLLIVTTVRLEVVHQRSRRRYGFHEQ